MRQHIDSFKWRRSQNTTNKAFYKLLIGICVVIALFSAAEFGREFVKAYENNLRISEDALVHHYNKKKEFQHPRWDYYPHSRSRSRSHVENKPKYGILMAGSRNIFEYDQPGSPLTLAMMSSCVNKLYAMKHKHAFKLVTNLEDVNNRTYGKCGGVQSMAPWNKIKLVEQYLPDVQYLLWLDLDAVIIRPNVFIQSILNVSNKIDDFEMGAWFGTENFNESIHELRRKEFGSSRDPFIWASRDLNPKYLINLNSAVFVIKNVPLAYEFLKDVWRTGDDPEGFKLHDWDWKHKKTCQGYYGWPWEQGGIWDVLSNESKLEYMRGTIMLPNDGLYALNSVTDQKFLEKIGTPFILHGKSIVECHLYYGKVLLRMLIGRLSDLHMFCPDVAARGDQFYNLTKDRKQMLRNEMSV